MATIGGTYSPRIGQEANNALARRVRAVQGRPWWNILFAMVGWIFAVLVWDEIPWFRLFYGAQLGQLSSGPLFEIFNLIRSPVLGCLICAVLGYQCVQVWQYAKAWRQLRGGAERPWSVSLSPEGYSSEDGTIKLTAPWAEFRALLPCGRFWMFVTGGRYDFVDARAFPNRSAERAFIAEALSYMSEEARARSTEATAFIEAK